MRSEWMKLFLCFNVSFTRIFSGKKLPEVMVAAVASYHRNPFVRVLRLMDSKKPAFIVFAWLVGILRIFQLRSLAKVAHAIVKTVPINVVNLTDGPFAMNIKPSKTMRSVPYVECADTPISKFSHPSGGPAKFGLATNLLYPSKRSSIFVIMKNAFKHVWREFFAWDSHYWFLSMGFRNTINQIGCNCNYTAKGA